MRWTRCYTHKTFQVDIVFLYSPFQGSTYQMLIGGPEMPQNRHTVKAEIKLTDDQVRRLKDDPSMRLMVYCGANTGINNYSAIDIAFPNQIEVKVNNEDIKSNFKGLKNTAGSTKPADITKDVRKLSGYANQISICYALTQKRFTFIVRLVKRQSAADLAERIKKARVIPKQQVIDEMNRANADPDIAATSSKMSLKDPVSITRITMPIRSTVCQHNQCFDGRYFMELQEQAPTWSCPICAKTVSFESLCVDKYFEEILETTSKDIEQVTIEPNGQWSVDRDDEDKGKSNHAKGEARAAWDDDFDDDVVEVQDSPPKSHTNGVKHEFLAASPMGPPGFSFNTPPLSSREASVARSNASTQRPAGNKRAASAVIDLTLDDDDDEEQPPRPAKRQTTGNPLGGPTSSYNTPTSLPEPIRTQAYLPQPVERNTTYRPFSAGQPMRPPTTQPSFSGPQSPNRTSPFTSFPPPSSHYAQSRPESQSPALANGYGPFSQSIRPPSQGYGTSQSPVGQSSPQPPPSSQQHHSGPTFSPFPPPRLDQQQHMQQHQTQHQQQQQQHELFDFGRSRRELGNWRSNYGQQYPDPK
jgi:E3 SUMO-protein ligase PIAS1